MSDKAKFEVAFNEFMGPMILPDFFRIGATGDYYHPEAHFAFLGYQAGFNASQLRQAQ